MMRAAQAGQRLRLLGGRAPELADYQDEPPQMASSSPGKSGYLRLGFARRGSRSVLQRMERRAPFLVQRALYWDEQLPHMPCVFLISTTGCLLQGDRMAAEIHVAPHACGHVTTQSATKIHAMKSNYAAQSQSLTLDEGSYLEVIPDPLIPHKGSRFITDTRITLHPTATLILAETLLSGRKHHPSDGGFRFDVYSSHLSARNPEGRELFAERYVLEPGRQPLDVAGVMGSFDVVGSVLLLTPVHHHQRIIDRILPVWDEAAGIASGVSRLPNDCGLMFRVVGRASQPVRSAIHGFWRVAREEILDVTLPEPFLWR